MKSADENQWIKSLPGGAVIKRLVSTNFLVPRLLESTVELAPRASASAYTFRNHHPLGSKHQKQSDVISSF